MAGSFLYMRICIHLKKGTYDAILHLNYLRTSQVLSDVWAPGRQTSANGRPAPGSPQVGLGSGCPESGGSGRQVLEKAPRGRKSKNQELTGVGGVWVPPEAASDHPATRHEAACPTLRLAGAAEAEGAGRKISTLQSSASTRLLDGTQKRWDPPSASTRWISAGSVGLAGGLSDAKASGRGGRAMPCLWSRVSRHSPQQSAGRGPAHTSLSCALLSGARLPDSRTMARESPTFADSDMAQTTVAFISASFWQVSENPCVETQPRSRPVCQHLGLGPNTTTISARRHCDVPRAPSCPSPSATVAVQPQRQVPRSLKRTEGRFWRDEYRGGKRQGEAADRISCGSAPISLKEDSDLKRARCQNTTAHENRGPGFSCSSTRRNALAAQGKKRRR